MRNAIRNHGASAPTCTRRTRGPNLKFFSVQLVLTYNSAKVAAGRRRTALARSSVQADENGPSTSTSASISFPRNASQPPHRASAKAAASAKATAAAAAVAALPLPAVPLSFADRAGIHDAAGRLMLKNLTLAELEEWCLSVGEPAKRAKQLYRWLYGSRKWIRSLDQADGDPHSFSASFKNKVASSANLAGGLQLQSVHSARDGTRKLVFALVEECAEAATGETDADAAAAARTGAGAAEAGAEPAGGEGGQRHGAAVAAVAGQAEGRPGGSGRALVTRGTVETVLIPMTNRSGQNLRYTACLSTQVGCAMNCQFCYTGRMGLLGNLSTAQIVEQVVEARRYLAEQSVDIPIANIVFMGMGEPLHNYDAVMAAIEILAVGLELSRNKIIVSTVGLVPEMVRFINSKAAKLAVSLHATTDEVRDWIVPTNRRYPLDELLGALRIAFPYDAVNRRNCNGKSDDFVVIEYVLLAGVNDSVADAERLVALTSDIYCIVNLIVFNPHEGTAFQRSSDEDVRAFRGVFAAAGRLCTVRTSKGDDEMAACGQLGDVSISSRPAPLLRPPEGLAERLAALKAQQAAEEQAGKGQELREGLLVA